MITVSHLILRGGVGNGKVPIAVPFVEEVADDFRGSGKLGVPIILELFGGGFRWWLVLKGKGMCYFLS
jgi:hypothetical protein